MLNSINCLLGTSINSASPNLRVHVAKFDLPKPGMIAFFDHGWWVMKGAKSLQILCMYHTMTQFGDKVTEILFCFAPHYSSSANSNRENTNLSPLITLLARNPIEKPPTERPHLDIHWQRCSLWTPELKGFGSVFDSRPLFALGAGTSLGGPP